MKVVLLAGGFGTRISEESMNKPKPMIEIGEMPILWHIMKHYSYYGYNEFVICAGYKQRYIKEWFQNYFIDFSDVTFDYTNGQEVVVHHKRIDPWKVTIVDTGLRTMTGGRVKRIREYVNEEPFMLTYGDGVADVNIEELVKFHRSHGKTVTMTAVNVGQQFGVLEIGQNGRIIGFREKSKSDGGIINAGYMVMDPEVFDYIEGDSVVLEREPIERIAADGQLMAYMHYGFWKCMDTQRDREQLEQMIASGSAPWMVWAG